MTLPGLNYSRSDGNTGASRAVALGVIAIIACSSIGNTAKPTSATGKTQAVTTFGAGDLPEYGSHIVDVGKKPVVLCRAAEATPGSYGTITTAGQPGSSPSVITASAATKPVDRFRVVVQFTAAGTVGTAGIKWRASLNNGKDWLPEQALGTANTLVIADTGITLSLAAGGIAVGETVKFSTRGPLTNMAGIQACLDALKNTGLTYEAVLVGSLDASATEITGVRTALNAFLAKGLSKRAFMNVRAWDFGNETSQAYIDALTIVSNAGRTGTRVNVCADGGFLVSPIRGIDMYRPLALGMAARVAKIAAGTDAAAVEDGPLDGFSILDSDGNPCCWDEAATPGLDDLGFTTLRTIARRSGCYIGNARIFSPVGSDYVFDQHERTMCIAEERSYDFLLEELSAAKRKDPILGPQGQVFLLEADLADIEQRGTLDLKTQLDGQVTDVRLRLSRVDDVGANTGATLTAWVEISPLVYLKGFNVTTRFVRSFNV